MKKQIRIPKWVQYALGLVVLALLIIPGKVLAGGLGFATMTNFSSVDFDDEQVRDLADVVMDQSFDMPDINEFHTIVQGIITGKQIVYAGILEKITKADEGCGTGATSKSIVFRQKKWEPARVKVWLQLCAEEFEQNLMVYAKNKGLNIDDITEGSGKEIADFMVDHIKPAMMEDAFRIAWFNDTDHSNVSDSGGTNEITDAVSLTDYNMIDGLWKQIFDVCTTTPARRVTITENAEATYDDQLNLASDTAYKLFKSLLKKADPRLRSKKDKVIIVTTTIFDNFVEYLESKSQEPAWVALTSGMQALKFRGITIIAFDFWDRTIQGDFDNGTTYLYPNRALLTTKANLMIGLDSSEALNDLEIWYSKDSEKNNFRGKYKVDAKIASDFMFEAGY